MELIKIIQYQKIDMELYKLEKEYGQSKEIEQIYRLRKSFEERRENLKKLKSELDESLSILKKLNAQMDDFNQATQWVEFVNILEVNQENLNALASDYTQFEEEIDQLSKNLNKVLKRINEINSENRKTNEEMINLNREYKRTNTILEKKKSDMLELAKPIVEKLNVLKRDIDKEILEKYKALRKAKKMPAFVVYNDGNCGGCGMDISIEIGKKITNDGDIAECPHCGRIVYKRSKI